MTSEARRYSGLFTSCRTKSRPYSAIWSSRALGKKQGVSETRNAMGVPALVVKLLEELLVFLREKVTVECLAQSGNHGQSSIRNRPFSMICRPSTQISNLRPTTSMCVPEYHFAPVCSP